MMLPTNGGFVILLLVLKVTPLFCFYLLMTSEKGKIKLVGNKNNAMT